MTIYILDQIPDKCAEMLDDKSLDTMILDIAQSLCNVHHKKYQRLNNFYNTPIKADLKFEEWVTWARECQTNYIYLSRLGLILYDEHAFRFGKTCNASKNFHKLKQILYWTSDNIPYLPTKEWSAHSKFTAKICLPLIMPEKHKHNKIQIILDAIDGTDLNTISAYRNYYQARLNRTIMKNKSYDSLSWTNRKKPEFVKI